MVRLLFLILSLATGLTATGSAQVALADSDYALRGWPAYGVGADTAYLRQRFGPPQDTSGYHSPGMSEWAPIWVYPQFTAYTDLGGYVIAVEITAPGPSTARGLQVGDPSPRALALYGVPLEASESELMFSDHGLDGIRITISRGQVTRLWVGSFLTGD